MKLGDIVTLVRGNTYKSSLLSETEGPVLLGLGSIREGGGFKRGTWKHYPEEPDSRIILHPGDLYVSLKDLTQSCNLLGAVSRTPADLKEGRLTQDTVKLEFNPSANELDKQYVYWSLRTPQYRAYCKARGTGTTNMSLSRSDFLDWEIPAKSKTRNGLISLFECIETKIELNNQINDYLDEYSTTLFENWLSRCTNVVTIGEIAEEILDYSKLNGPFAKLINSSDVTEGVFPSPKPIENKDLKGHFKKRFRKYDILYSEIRPRNHHYGYVMFEADDWISTTRLMVIRNKPSMISSGLLYYYLKSNCVTDEFTLKTETRSGTFPQGKYVDMASIKVPYSPVEMQGEIANKIASVLKAIHVNQTENEKLNELRNILLPKLMSGDIDVSKVDITQLNNHLSDC